MPLSAHRIRWKGRTDGPFTRDEIRARLAEGELSLLHRIEVDGQWMSLGDFLNGPAGSLAPAARPGKAALLAAQTPRTGENAMEEARLHKIGYFLCGACFVLPILATFGVRSVAGSLRRRGDRETARTLNTLGTLLTLLGLTFWIAVVLANARGLL